MPLQYISLLGLMDKIMTDKQWESYEEVAAYLLNEFAEHFNVGKFEGKQIVPGNSGTKWEIDAKGCTDNDSSFLVVECKRHTKNGISQAITASLAWTIQDTGGTGGILVSPLGLQEGAKKVADKSKIVEVVLDQDSTTTDYMLSFLNHVCIGVSDTIGLSLTDKLEVTVIDKDGNVVDERSV